MIGSCLNFSRLKVKYFVLVIIFALSTSCVSAKEKSRGRSDSLSECTHILTDQAPAAPLIESAFSPDAGSETLVLKVIHTAHDSIRLAAYSFTSPAIVRALLNAKRRGVDVRVVVDDRGNRSKASVAALNLLVNAGIPTRTLSAYAIHHDKFIVSDGKHVQTGSFNYSKAAAKSNSENVLVIWHHPEIAAAYLQHWQNRYDQGKEYHSSY